MVILDPNGMTFDAVGVFGLVFQLLFKSGSSYCEIVSPISNCESTNFLKNIYYDFFYSWQTEKKTILDQ